MQHELSLRPAMQAIDPGLIFKQPTLTKSLHLCQTLSGKDDAQFYGERGIVKDQAQWSRIMGQAGSANFPQDKLNLFMDIAENEAPMLWLLHSRGYDITVLRKLETDTERRLRLTMEELAAEKAKNRILVEAWSGRAPA